MVPINLLMVRGLMRILCHFLFNTVLVLACFNRYLGFMYALYILHTLNVHAADHTVVSILIFIFVVAWCSCLAFLLISRHHYHLVANRGILIFGCCRSGEGSSHHEGKRPFIVSSSDDDDGVDGTFLMNVPEMPHGCFVWAPEGFSEATLSRLFRQLRDLQLLILLLLLSLSYSEKVLMSGRCTLSKSG